MHLSLGQEQFAIADFLILDIFWAEATQTQR